MNYQQMLDYQKRKIRELIRGIEDSAWAESYADEILSNCADDIQSLMRCLQELHAVYFKQPEPKRHYTRIKVHGAFYDKTNERT